MEQLTERAEPEAASPAATDDPADSGGGSW